MNNIFWLENGIMFKGNFSCFKLYYNDIELTPTCHEIAYIPKTLIAVKSNNTVFAYKPIIAFYNNTYSLIKLASFDTVNCNAYLKVKISDKMYIIDSNVGVSLCECAKMYY